MVRTEQPSDQGDSSKHVQPENTAWKANTLADTYGPNASLSSTPTLDHALSMRTSPNLPKGVVENDGSINFAGPDAGSAFGGKDSPWRSGPDVGDPSFIGPHAKEGGGKLDPPNEGDNPLDKPGEKPVDPKVQQLANDQQLQVRTVTKDGKDSYEFYTTIDGVDRVMTTTDTNPEVAEQQLKQAQEDKIRQLEQTYNVHIARTGETTKSYDGKTDLPVTTPTLGELSALSETLVRSVPDTATTDGKPLRIVIGDKSWGDKLGKGILGVHRDDEVVIGAQDNLSYLKEVGIHEMAHVGQDHRYAATGAEEYANELGWVKAGDKDLMRDKDGNLWWHDKDNEWVRTDADGNPCDANGRRLDNPWNPFDHGEDDPRAIKRTNAEMRDQAAVKPFSEYFGNPTEMGAALLTPFRDNRQLREDLYNVSPDSYALAKKLDQDQINAAMGTNPDGSPKFIRNPDGMVVENNEEHRREVEEYERGFRK